MSDQDSFSNNNEEGQLAVDVLEDEESIFVIAPISGVGLEDVAVLVENETLTISGERKYPLAQGGKNFLAKECFWGKFSRTIILPSSAEKDKVEASFSKGVLRIRIPKKDSEKSKIIKIIEE